jgi:rod shape-determining protein MreC
MLIGKNRLIRRRVIIGLLLAASLTLLTLSFREGSGEGVIGGIQRTALAVTAPVSEVVHRVTQPIADAWDWTAGLVDARQENERLKAQLEQAGAQNVEIEQARDRIAELERLLEFKQSNQAGSFDVAAASVIGISPNDYNRTITLNLGSNDGVSVNDPVVAPYGDGAGLVGRVTEVTGDVATVMLILDRDSAITASVVPDSTAKGVLVPSTADPGLLSLTLVGADEQVDRGMTVVTGGYQRTRLDPLLPIGIPIGTITNWSQTDVSVDKTIQVTPFVDFQDLTDVLVILQGRG